MKQVDQQNKIRDTQLKIQNPINSDEINDVDEKEDQNNININNIESQNLPNELEKLSICESQYVNEDDKLNFFENQQFSQYIREDLKNKNYTSESHRGGRGYDNRYHNHGGNNSNNNLENDNIDKYYSHNDTSYSKKFDHYRGGDIRDRGRGGYKRHTKDEDFNDKFNKYDNNKRDENFMYDEIIDKIAETNNHEKENNYGNNYKKSFDNYNKFNGKESRPYYASGERGRGDYRGGKKFDNYRNERRHRDKYDDNDDDYDDDNNDEWDEKLKEVDQFFEKEYRGDNNQNYNERKSYYDNHINKRYHNKGEVSEYNNAFSLNPDYNQNSEYNKFAGKSSGGYYGEKKGDYSNSGGEKTYGYKRGYGRGGFKKHY